MHPLFKMATVLMLSLGIAAHASAADTAEDYVKSGLAKKAKGDLAGAMADYIQAIQLNPNYAEAHNNLANALLKKGQLMEAIAQYQKALEIKPDFAEARCNLGAALQQTGRTDDAIAQYQKTLEINPDYVEARERLGGIYLKTGRTADAIEQFQKALKTQPQDATIQNNLAYVLAACPQAALRDGAKALELASQANKTADGKNVTILGTLAAAYAEAGRFADAVQTAQKALALATTQSNTAQIALLRSQLELYKAGTPYRDKSLGN